MPLLRIPSEEKFMRRPSSIVKSAAKYVTRSLQHPAVAVIAIALVGVFATAPVWAGAFWVDTSNSITGRGFASVGDAANWWWNNDPAKNIPNRQFQFAGTISCLPQQPNVPPNAGHTGYCTSIKYTNSAPQAVTAIYWDPNTPSPPKNFSVAPSAPPPPIISNPGPVPTNQCATKPIVSNPINFGTGDKYQSETDYVGKSGLMFTRYYHSSQFVSAANLGSQWRHNYDRRITVFEDTVTHAVNFVTVTRGDGQQYQFTLQNGVWTPESDIVDQLTPLTTGGVSTGWQLATPAEEVETYDVQGKLVSIALRTGSLITFAYSNATTPLTIAPVAGLLISVMDPFGRQLNFTYDANQRLAKTIDPEGNVFAYSYDANDNLFVVSYPDLTPSDPLDNPKRTYVYDGGSCKTRLMRRIISRETA